jgi:Mg2+-importing ATPase
MRMNGLPDRFWALDAERLFADLGASRDGLTTAEAEQRLETCGRNVVIETPRRRILTRIAKRLLEPLVAILIVAAALSGAMGDWASSSVIFVILGISIMLEAAQEHRAETTADQLKQSVAIRTQVRRDGRVMTVPVDRIVPGDIVELEAGDLVPADGLVVASHGAHTNEALLTGEAYPVEKRAGSCPASIPAEAFNALFGGTALVSGTAAMLVVATGAKTRLGGIAAALHSAEPPTPFERGLHAFGVLILRLTGFLVLFVLLAHLAFGRPVLQSFLFAVALAIGLTPELLPMIVTVTLSRGALRLAARKVVVKRLAAIHDLGAMDVLCTDKTGTLTEARISLVGHVGVSGRDSARVLELAAVNTRFERGMKSPLDDAIAERSAALPLAQWRHVGDVPFDFERRRVSLLADRAGRRLLVVKGAAEGILANAVAVEREDGTVAPLDDATRQRLGSIQEGSAGRGIRCLGVAWRELPSDRSQASPDDERDLVFAGFCLFEDPPRQSAAGAIAQLQSLGVRLKIVSGDTPAVVRHLVDTLQLPSRGLLTGAELAELSDGVLASRVEEVDVFARVTPDQKVRIIAALQANRHSVGFLGDGINDAPAIRAADVGISVDQATDVARAAADMIMLAPDLGVLADGVEEGRRTYANIMKYVRMGTSSNFGNMLSMAASSVFIPFLPLTPVQVLLNNLLYDVSETGIPFDRVEPDDIREPHAWDMSAVLRFTFIMGPLSSLFDMATFAILILGFGADPQTFRTAWFVESITTQILVIFVIRTLSPAWLTRPHRILVATSLGALAVGWAISISPLGKMIGFSLLSWALIAVVACLVAGYLVAAELIKRLAMTRFADRRPRR